MWRRVWKLPIKPKLKHFIWKCIHGWVASNEAVKRRGMVTEGICKRCGMENESLEHLFFQCVESTLVWKLSPVKWDDLQRLAGSFASWWRALCRPGGNIGWQRGVDFTVYLLWHIWKARNSWQFQGQKVEAQEVVKRALKE